MDHTVLPANYTMPAFTPQPQSLQSHKNELKKTVVYMRTMRHNAYTRKLRVLIGKSVVVDRTIELCRRWLMS